MLKGLSVLNFVDNSLESCGIVKSEVSEDLAVDLDACLVDETHEFGVGKILEACGGVDTLDPESAEVTLFIFTVTVCVCKTFFPCVFGNGPYIAAAAEITAGKFQNFFTTGAGCDVVY